MANEYLNNSTFESIIKSFQKLKQKRMQIEMIIRDLEETHNRRFKKHSDDSRKAPLDKAKQDQMEFNKDYMECQESLAYAFHLLSAKIANHFKFRGIDPEDATQEGVVICFEKVGRFDPRRGSKAFNYITTCILNHFRQLYRSARHYIELQKRFQIHQIQFSNDKYFNRKHFRKEL